MRRWIENISPVMTHDTDAQACCSSRCSLGSGIEVLKPAIAKWRPSVIYAFTSLEENVKIVRGHLGESWRKLYAPDEPPEIRVVPCPEPWRAKPSKR